MYHQRKLNFTPVSGRYLLAKYFAINPSYSIYDKLGLETWNCQYFVHLNRLASCCCMFSIIGTSTSGDASAIVPSCSSASSSSDSDLSSQTSCQCQCCSEPHTPYQPLELTESAVSHTHHSKERKNSQIKSYSRHIQPSWYKSFPWISVCSSNFKIYCATCRNAKYRGLLSFPKHQKTAFVEDGFMNWKKALQKFREHESSVMHKEAILKLAATKSTTRGIGAQLSAQHDADQRHHRQMLMKLLSCIKYLARQGLPFRGHYEDVESFEGNLYQLLLLQAQDCPEMKTWLRKKEYISPEIINEIIMIMGQSVLRELLGEIKSSLWFSILADEATDISHHEQMSLSIRWVDDGYTIHEDTLGLIQLPDTKSRTIFDAIKDILIRCSLPLSQCRGQAFDGAANMSGIRNGVQALVKSEASQALYVHCLAHNLNLCLKDVTKTCDLVRNVMSFIYDLVQLIKFSPKRLSLFDTLRKEVVVNSGDTSVTPSLRMLCPTRWTVRHTSIDSIIRNYQILQTALEEIHHGHDEYAAKASGLMARMEQFDTYFALKLAHLVFSAAEQLSINMQAKDITIQEAINGAKLLTTHFKSLRNEAKFDFFYDRVCQDCRHLTEEPRLPRPRKIPRRLDEGAATHQYQNPKARYRHAYFEILELAAGEVEKRFDQADLNTIKEIEVLLLKAGNGEIIDSIPPVIQSYLDKDVDEDRLKTQLPLVCDMIKTAFSGSLSSGPCPRAIKSCAHVRKSRTCQSATIAVHTERESQKPAKVDLDRKST